MMNLNEVEEGDFVVTPYGVTHWCVKKIHSRIDPLGVLLESGQTGRARYETYSNLVLFKKGGWEQ